MTTTKGRELGDTADLLDTLERVEARAAATMRSLSAGTATTGSAALAEIRAEARDARRRGIANREGLDHARDHLPAA